MKSMRNKAEAAAALDAAKVVLLPSGRDTEACAQSLREQFNLDVPEFPKDERKLSRKSGGRKFVQVKGKDVPPLVAGIDDCVGAAGTDVWIERRPAGARLSACEIGRAMGSFAVLAPEGRVCLVREQMLRIGSPVVAATSYPNILTLCAAYQDLNIVPADFQPSGSVEAMVELGIAGVVADIASTYETARRNGLAEVMDLLQIKPLLIWQEV